MSAASGAQKPRSAGPDLGSADPLKKVKSQASLRVDAARVRRLWDLSGARSHGLDVEILSTHTADGYRTDELYITSRITPSGPDRIFCTFARPLETTTSVPAYIDLTGGRAIEGVTWLARNYRGAVLDIEWRSPDLKHKTIWARPSKAGLFGLNQELDDDFNAMFVNGIRRAIDFLESQPGIDPKRIACGGGSMGGWYSLFVAGVDPRVSAVFSFYGVGGGVSNFTEPLTPAQNTAWTRAFDPLTYAGQSRAATMLYLGTNDYFFSLGNAMVHQSKLKTENRMIIVPNDDHHFGPFGKVLPEIDKHWLDHLWHGAPALATVGQPRSRGARYTWPASGPRAIQSAMLCWSPGAAVWPARYWVEIPATRTGNNWSASIPGGYDGLVADLFATVTDEDGRSVSSRLVHRNGADPQAAPVAEWPGGALWDVATGAAAWRPSGPSKNYGLWAQTLTTTPTGQVTVTSVDPTGKISILTNSVVFACGQSSRYKGIRLAIDGKGKAGEILVSLERGSNHSSCIAYTHKANFGPDSTVIEIPWLAFKGPEGSPASAIPFDGLRFDVDRGGKTPLVFDAIELLN